MKTWKTFASILVLILNSAGAGANQAGRLGDCASVVLNQQANPVFRSNGLSATSMIGALKRSVRDLLVRRFSEEEKSAREVFVNGTTLVDGQGVPYSSGATAAIYVVTANGRLLIERNPGMLTNDLSLAGENSVTMAGRIVVHEGAIQFIDNRGSSYISDGITFSIFVNALRERGVGVRESESWDGRIMSAGQIEYLRGVLEDY